MKLLKRLGNYLNNKTFYGDEAKKVHAPSVIDFEYSPGKFRFNTNNPHFNSPAFLEMAFSNDFDVTDYKEQDGLTGRLKVYPPDEIDKFKDYGIISNFFRRDPRYLLENSRNYKKVASGIYTMDIWDKQAKKMGNLVNTTGGMMANVVQSAEFHLGKNRLERMIVKTHFLRKSGTVEQLFTDITFRY